MSVLRVYVLDRLLAKNGIRTGQATRKRRTAENSLGLHADARISWIGRQAGSQSTPNVPTTTATRTQGARAKAQLFFESLAWAVNRKESPFFTILPADGVAKCVPKTTTLVSAYFSQNARRVFFAIAPSESNPSSHSG